MTQLVSSTTSEDGVRTLVFDIARPDVLSSNVAAHHYLKSKNIRTLRRLAIEAGLALHSESDQEAVSRRVEELQTRQDWQTKKSAISKKLAKKGLSKQEIAEHADILAIGDKTSYDAANAIIVPFLYEKARVRILVGNTVNRDFDPPNLWPTVKALTDGLTDCAWWKDDNFNHLTEISFGYGERSPEKGHYRFTVIVEPVAG